MEPRRNVGILWAAVMITAAVVGLVVDQVFHSILGYMIAPMIGVAIMFFLQYRHANS